MVLFLVSMCFTGCTKCTDGLEMVQVAEVMTLCVEM